MAYDQAKLEHLRQQVARKKYLERSLNSLTSQERVLHQQMQLLKVAMRDAQADVTRLEKHSLTALYYHMLGKLDEQLDKERAEACAARVKYDTAVLGLASVETDMEQTKTELAELADCDQAYEQALHEKLEVIKAAGLPGAGEIREMETKLADLEARQTELVEAISAGQDARDICREVVAALDDADAHATWDVLGSGLLADAAKHNHLDNAQELVNKLQTQLNRFRNEVMDVTEREGIHVSMGSFTRFADFFFDGLFADWAVKEHIQSALELALQTQEQIEDILRNLSAMAATTKSRYTNVKKQLDEAVLDAQVG